MLTGVLCMSLCTVAGVHVGQYNGWQQSQMNLNSPLAHKLPLTRRGHHAWRTRHPISVFASVLIGDISSQLCVVAWQFDD